MAAPIIIHHPDYQAPLRPGHPFPMSKYGYLREALIARGLMAPGGYAAPAPAPASLLAGAHDPAYVSRVFALALSEAEQKRIGLPRTERVVRRARLSAAGTALAAELALDAAARPGAPRVAMNTAGGSHHAGPGFGSGFSTFNDVAVAARRVLAAGRARRILVLDLDVHQGDGTALIFAADPRVATISIHGARNFPFEKTRSDLDLALEDGAGDAAYMAALAEALAAARAVGPFDLAFLNAGVDVHAEDRLGRLALSDAGLRARDRAALEGLADLAPALVTVVGGGYGEDPERVAARHAVLFEEAFALFA